jgi:hypothetical protein
MWMTHSCHRLMIRERGTRAAVLLIFAALSGSSILLSAPGMALAQFRTPGQKLAPVYIAGSAGVNAPPESVNEAYYSGRTGIIGGIPHLIHAGAGTLAAAFAHCPGGRTPSNMCTVEVDPGQTYVVPSALIIGSDRHPQTLLCMGGTIFCTDTGGRGHACLVLHDKGHLIAPAGQGGPAADQGCLVTSTSTTNIDSLVESYAAYEADLPTPVKYQQANLDVENISIAPNPGMTLNKAVFWPSAIDGSGYISNVYVGAGPEGATGVLVDDAPIGSGFSGMYWNNINFINVVIGMRNDAIGLDVQCRSGGGANLTWVGGAIVDGGPPTLSHINIDGHKPYCGGILLENPYFESGDGQSDRNADYIDLGGVDSVVGHSLIFNGGPGLANCVKIKNTGIDQIHVDGRAMGTDRCRNVINNAIDSYQNTAQGAFDYTYSYTSNGSQPLKQVDGLLNPFGPGGQGLYYSAAGTALPSCTPGLARYFTCVSDSTACTSGSNYSPGGSAACLVQCNNRGNAWKETGVPCF